MLRTSHLRHFALLFGSSLALTLALFGGLGNWSIALGAPSLCVEPTGAGGCYTTIAGAVAAAANGETIQIHAGTYYENVDAGSKSLTFQGDGRSATIVDGGNNARVFQVNSGYNLTLYDLTVRNGNAGISSGGGIYLGGSANLLTLVNVDVLSSTAGAKGGGAYSYGSATISNTNFISNTAGITSAGSGAGLFTQATLTVTSGRFERNVSYGGSGGGLAQNGSLYSATITGTHFYSNTAGNGNGGGASITGATGVVENAYFQGNQATGTGIGGAVYAPSGTGASLEAMNVDAFNNMAVNGGAIYANRDATISGGRYINNMGDGGSGHGGALCANKAMTVTDAQIIGNSAALGGGIMQWTGGLKVVNTLLARNTAPDKGPALYLANSSGEPAQIVNSTIATPTVSAGSAIYSSNGAFYVTNTLISGYATGIQRAGVGSPAEDYNLFAQVTTQTSGVTGGGHSRATSNAHFVDPANDDYHLLAGSGAAARGIDAGVTLDMDGNTRPNPPSIGAYEGTAQQGEYAFTNTASLTSEVPYKGVVTYTLVISNNTPLIDSRFRVTDVLPAGVTFKQWLTQPAYASNVGSTVTYSGPITDSTVLTLGFLVTNTTSGGAVITNTAVFTGTDASGSATAVFGATTTECVASQSNGWSLAFASCILPDVKKIIPAGITVTLDRSNLTLSGDFEVQAGGALSPGTKTLTLTGSRAQTLTGSPLTFYNLVVNKTSPTDTVAIAGKLKVTKKLSLTKGKLFSASDYEDVEIGADGVLSLTNPITIGGDFTVTGQLVTNGNSISFDGAKLQRLYADGITIFDDLIVITDTTLLEAYTQDNILVNGTLANYGVIRKYKDVSAAEAYSFGLAGAYNGADASIEVTNQGSLNGLQVDRVDANPANPPGSQTTGIYWTITPTGTGYTANVTLPHAGLTNPGACRQDALGAWDCGQTNFDTTTVNRSDVTAFSSWAVFELQPTTTTVTGVPAQTLAQTDVTFTVTVTAPEGAGTPSGQVILNVAGPPQVLTLTNGVAVFTTADLPVGEHDVTAQYQGGELFAPSNSMLGHQSITCTPGYVVKTTVDGGPNSLRQALSDVCAGGTVSFAPALTASGPNTITLTAGGYLYINKNMAINGPGAGLLAISGRNNVRIFYVESGVAATIDALTLRDGSSGTGAAIQNKGLLTVTASSFISNAASLDGGAIAQTSLGGLVIDSCTFMSNTALTTGMDGGAIYFGPNFGSTLIRNSTFSGNRAYEGGAIRSRSELHIVNSTFVANEAMNAAGGGGALRLNGPAYITNTTIISNSAPGNGGGVRITAATGTFTMVNSLAANNTGAACSSAGATLTGSNNLATDATCGGSFTQISEALLGATGAYGGSTQAAPLLPGSPAIDAGDALACPATDQRGVIRPQGSLCDVGAFESRGFTFGTSGGGDQHTAISTAFAQPLTVTIMSAYAEPVMGGKIGFVGPASGAGINPTPLTATVDAAGMAAVNVTANLFTDIQSYQVVASGAGVAGTFGFTLTNDPGPLVRLELTGYPSPSAAGATQSYTVTTRDVYSNVVTNYTGTVTFSSTDVQANLPAPYTFTGADHGAKVFTAALKTTGMQTITATDAVRSVAGSRPDIQIDAGAPAAINVVTGSVQGTIIGTPFATTLSVVVTDTYNNMLAGVPVTFTAPATNASGVFTDNAGAGHLTFVGVTGITGTLAANQFIANLVAGGYEVTAAAEGVADPARFALTNLRNASGAALATSGTPSVFGQPVIFTATVTSTVAGMTPTGIVTFTMDGTDVGTQTLDAAGVATYTTSTLAVGAHTVAAQYGGDHDNEPSSTSLSGGQTVSKAGTSVALTAFPEPSVYSETVTITATVMVSAPGAGVPSGTVKFKDNSVLLPVCIGRPLTNGVAVCATNTLTTSTHVITAYYMGDASFQESSGALDSGHTVIKADTNAALDSSPNPSVFGESVTFTATVTVAPPAGTFGVQAPTPGGLRKPTGIVTFTVDQAFTATATLNANGIATYAKADLSTGDHDVKILYGGDNNYNSSNAGPLTQTVNRFATNTAVSSSDNPAVFGQSVTLTATVMAVAPGTGLPSGVVTFTIDSLVVATATLDANSEATYVTAALDGGNHPVRVDYAGDGSFSPSSGNLLNGQTVDKASTVTALLSAANPTLYGQSAVFTATVAATAPGTGTPEGEVIFSADGAAIGGCEAVVTSGAVAACTTDLLAAGTHTVTAEYAGSANYLGSTSPAYYQVVQPLPVAVNDAGGTLQETPVTLTVLANDLDPAGGGLLVTAITLVPVHGAVTVAPGGQTVLYTPETGFSGQDSFLYVATDANNNSDDALVTVMVTARSQTAEPPQIEPVNPQVDVSKTFTSPAANVEVELPANFYTDTLSEKEILFLSYTPVVTATEPTHTPPSNLKFGNFEFDLTLFRNNEPQHDVQFEAPLTVTIAYDPAMLNGLREDLLDVYFWNGTAWSKDGITVVGRDLTNHTVTFLLAHLSHFGFFSNAPTASDPAPEPGTAPRLYLPGVMCQQQVAGPAAMPESDVDQGAAVDGANHLYLPALNR